MNGSSQAASDTKTLAWVSFWILASVWGSSFLLIRVGVAEIPPSQLVFIRTFIAAVGLNIVAFARGKRLPTDRRTIGLFALIGFGNAALPYLLLGMGEQVIESSVASVLQATVSMFSLVIAHFALADERMTPRKVVGLLLGFIGVVVLATRAAGEAHVVGGIDSTINGLWGYLAVIGASLSYASFTVLARKTVSQRLDPIVIAAGTFIFSALSGVGFMVLEPALGGRAPVDFFSLSPDVIGAALMLGFANTFVAYLFFYYIVQQLGAFRATNVTYVVPVVGVILGWLVLGERIDWRLLLGATLIFMGLGVINVRARQSWQRLRQRAAPTRSAAD